MKAKAKKAIKDKLQKDLNEIFWKINENKSKFKTLVEQQTVLKRQRRILQDLINMMDK